MGKERRVMLKLSGEALAGEKRFGFEDDIIREVAREVKPALERAPVGVCGPL